MTVTFSTRGAFSSFFFGFLVFPLEVDSIGKVVFVRELGMADEIIKSINAGVSLTGKDGMKMVFLKADSPFCVGRALKLYGKQDGTEHIRRKS